MHYEIFLGVHFVTLRTCANIAHGLYTHSAMRQYIGVGEFTLVGGKAK